MYELILIVECVLALWGILFTASMILVLWVQKILRKRGLLLALLSLLLYLILSVLLFYSFSFMGASKEFSLIVALAPLAVLGLFWMWHVVRVRIHG